jgi:hypothetical protein
MTVGEFVVEINDRAAPASAEELAQFEAELGTSLPDDYRRFLVACNGGHVGGALWFYGSANGNAEARAGIHHVFGFRREPCYSLRQRRAGLQLEDLRIPLDLLPVMDDPLGNKLCIGLTVPHRGRVFFWDHENEPDPDEWDGRVETAGNLSPLADSFTEFVAGVRPF